MSTISSKSGREAIFGMSSRSDTSWQSAQLRYLQSQVCRSSSPPNRETEWCQLRRSSDLWPDCSRK